MHSKKNIEKKVIEIVEKICSREVEQINTNIFMNPFYQWCMINSNHSGSMVDRVVSFYASKNVF